MLGIKYKPNSRMNKNKGAADQGLLRLGIESVVMALFMNYGVVSLFFCKRKSGNSSN